MISNLYFLTLRGQYSLKTCPHIFKNTKMTELLLSSMRSSCIDSNILNFLKTTYDLNSNIFSFSFDMYRIQLDENILNKKNFRHSI